MIRPTADDATPLTTPQLLLPINNNNISSSCTGLASSSSSSNLREWLVLCYFLKIVTLA